MRAFFDSNVFVYALASDDTTRQEQSRAVIARHAAQGSLVLSPQVLMETYNVLTRKKHASADDALAALRLLARQQVVSPDADTTLQAMVMSAEHGLSPWDALIVRTALQAGCDTLYSEDLQAGRRFGSLEIVNPFVLGAHEAVPAPVAPRRKAGPKAIRRAAA